MGPFTITICLEMKLTNNFTVPGRMSREWALLGKPTRQESARRKDMAVHEGRRVELASFARHEVDVCLSEGSLFSIPLPFSSINTTKWLC